MKRLILASLFLVACKTTGPDTVLTGDTAAAFRKIVKHDAITLSDSASIYGVEAPPGSQIACHEKIHRNQARVLGDAMVAIGAIDDDELPRAAVWISIYTIDFLQYSYSGSRFEKEARAACP